MADRALTAKEGQRTTSRSKSASTNGLDCGSEGWLPVPIAPDSAPPVVVCLAFPGKSAGTSSPSSAILVFSRFFAQAQD
jgi:hypothetical protein